MDILIRDNEATRPEPYLLWDSIFDRASGVADWALAGNAPLNAGGLVAAAGIETAVTLCLFSDARMPPAHPLSYLVADGDLRGWWGDAIDVRVDLGEAPLGSLLWVLRRAPLTPQIVRWAQTFALQALAPLQTQRAVARINCAASVNGNDALTLDVSLYGRDGAKVYDRAFDPLWAQLSAP